jgi:hypothetical protein
MPSRKLRLFLDGDRDVILLLVGKTSDGEWAGLKTTVVET